MHSCLCIIFIVLSGFTKVQKNNSKWFLKMVSKNGFKVIRKEKKKNYKKGKPTPPCFWPEWPINPFSSLGPSLFSPSRSASPPHCATGRPKCRSRQPAHTLPFPLFHWRVGTTRQSPTLLPPRTVSVQDSRSGAKSRFARDFLPPALNRAFLSLLPLPNSLLSLPVPAKKP